MDYCILSVDPKSNFQVDIEEFGSETRKRNLRMSNVLLKLKLRYLSTCASFTRFIWISNRPVRTKQPVLVGYLNIKRPQQLVTKRKTWSGS